MPLNPSPQRLYTVEFLRIFFMLCILTHHTTWIHKSLASFMHSSGFSLNLPVEYFFIIAGFFLYKRVAHGVDDARNLIKKIYLRLLPGLLFAAALTILLGVSKVTNVPHGLAMLTGMAKRAFTGYGDWFICVYFWVSCLFVGLFQSKSKYAWIYFGVLIYLCIMLKGSNRYTPGDHIYGTYYGIITAGLVRGIICMGIGMVSSFLADRLTYSCKWPMRIVFTVFEVICLVNIYNTILNTKHCHTDYINTCLLMGAFLISIAHSWGYVSACLNKCNWVQYASRYTLPALFGHMICLSVLRRFSGFGMSDWPRALFVIFGGVFLGIVEYHLVEKWLVPIIKNYLHKHSSLSPLEP